MGHRPGALREDEAHIAVLDVAWWPAKTWLNWNNCPIDTLATHQEGELVRGSWRVPTSPPPERCSAAGS
jgi:hypothetical protein